MAGAFTTHRPGLNVTLRHHSDMRCRITTKGVLTGENAEGPEVILRAF
jgi:hypothetical protein